MAISLHVTLGPTPIFFPPVNTYVIEASSNFTILYIDDDEDDRALFEMALRHIQSEAKCITIESAITALSVLKQEACVPDLILLDLNIPQFNGFDFLTEAKQLGLPAHIIVLTTSANHDDIKRAKELGAYDFITKPNNYQDLCDLIKVKILSLFH